MILIHGECGSGKSAALRGLEAAPPVGVRAAYVPVPTLDLAGLASWCLDRLHVAPGADPIDALREAARRERLAILIDDADRLPLDAALAVRRLESDSAGKLVLVAACETALARTPAILALGVPARAIEFSEQSRAAALRELKECIAPRAEQQARAEPKAPQRATAQLSAAPAAAEEEGARLASAEPRRVIVAPPIPEPARTAAQRRVAATARRPAPAPEQPASAPLAAAPQRPQVARLSPQSAPPPETLVAAPPPSVQSQPRTIPLSLAIAMAITAFMLPVAFAAGYLLGTTPAASPTGSVAGESTPAVSAPPPAEEPATPARRSARRENSAARASRATAPRAARAATPVEPAPSSDAPPSGGESEEWGPAPSLLSVEPGAAAP